jgi:hypothetical protein
MIAFVVLSAGTIAFAGLDATTTADTFTGDNWIALLFGAAFFVFAEDAATGSFATTFFSTTFFVAIFFATTFFALLFAGTVLTFCFTFGDEGAADFVTITVDFFGATFFFVSFFFVVAILTSSN